jgi:hypothetical protein
MPHPEGQRSVTLVSAVMRRDGLPTFAVTQVAVTPDEYANGIHLYLAEADLLEAGFEEPFVHFPSDEAPPFLLAAVREYLGGGTPDAARPADGSPARRDGRA